MAAAALAKVGGGMLSSMGGDLAALPDGDDCPVLPAAYGASASRLLVPRGRKFHAGQVGHVRVLAAVA